jgi:hypothetical protein
MCSIYGTGIISLNERLVTNVFSYWKIYVCNLLCFGTSLITENRILSYISDVRNLGIFYVRLNILFEVNAKFDLIFPVRQLVSTISFCFISNLIDYIYYPDTIVRLVQMTICTLMRTI